MGYEADVAQRNIQVVHVKRAISREADIPGAAITRTFNRSSFESLVDHYGIKDPGLVGIGMLIHDIEINLWERKVFKKSREIEVFFIDLIQTRMEKKTVIEKSNAYFDALYEILSGDPERNPPS